MAHPRRSLALLAALAMGGPCQAAEEPGWLALMHYRAQGSGWQSEADRPHFFLSKDGRHAPRQELAANLAAMSAPAYPCTFPARYEWLRTRYAPALPARREGDCPELDAWYRQFPGQRVSISFAASFLENPSSMFGHTFLKVYRESPRELMSPTINYAARTDAREGDLDYIRKGLFGGFPGVADELPFYRRLRTYTENEGRDIWEYELGLTPAEVRQLLLHVWEVRDGIFDYYFLDENCAFRTLALIDVARPQARLLDHYSALTVPVETIRTLQAAGMAGAPVLWPGLPKLVRQYEAQLGADEVRQASAIADGSLAPDKVAQASVLQLAYEYLSVRITRDQAERETRKDTINAILRRRLAIGSPGSLQQAAALDPPESGHDGSAIKLGAYRDGARRGASLAWAGFQHTLTDRLGGYEPYAEVTVLQPELRSDGGRVRLERLDWLTVQSTLPGSALFSRSAWRLMLATQRKEDRLVTSLGFNSGQAWAVGNTVIAVMPGAGVEAGHATAAAGTLAVLATRQSSTWSAQAEFNAEKQFLGGHGYRSHARLRTSLMLSRNTALELSARRAIRPVPHTEIALGLRVHLKPLAFAQ
ncbi:MAG: DUF4105 domain-containing protein [Pseudomonadota bacterium]